MQQEANNTVLRRERCDNCASTGGDTNKDNKIVYADGHTYCNACGKYGNPTKPSKETPKKVANLIPGVIKAIKDRGITQQTCEKYNVRIGNKNNNAVVIYPIYDHGKVVKQKLRNVDDKSKQTQLGDTSCMKLFGQNLFNPSKNIPITITEGEYDAMCIHQATGYPAVSGVRGANGLLKEIQANLEWLSQWKFITLCLDQDEAGQEAANKVVETLEPGTVRIAHLPLKDANDMVIAGRSDEIKQCLFNAEIIKPPTLVCPSDIKDLILQQPEYGSKFPWPSMTRATYGLRWGETYLLAAPTAVGKTEFMREIVSQQVKNNVKCALFSFEQTPQDTIRRFIGAELGIRLHIPDNERNIPDSRISNMVDRLNENILLYNHSSGNLSFDQIIINIRYAAKCFGTKFFVLDNLKSLSVMPFIEGKVVTDIVFMAHVMATLAKLCRELNITVFVITHVNTDKISMTYQSGSDLTEREGLRWETGRVPTLENIYGGGKISDLVDYVLVLSRNRVSEDMSKRSVTHVKFLKTRLDSTYEGFTFVLKYDYNSGRLKELDKDIIK